MTDIYVVARGSDCSCAVCGDPVPCDHAWFRKGWRCPYVWRPNSQVVDPGSVVTFKTKARMWTSTPGNARSEIHRDGDFGGTLRQYDVAEVRVRKHYTTVQVECDKTRLAVWVRIWCRYNDSGQSCGVRWADLVRSGPAPGGIRPPPLQGLSATPARPFPGPPRWDPSIPGGTPEVKVPAAQTPEFFWAVSPRRSRSRSRSRRSCSRRP